MNHHSCPPELKLTAMLFVLAIFLYGCSSSYSVSSTGKPSADYNYPELNEKLKGQYVEIKLRDGRNITAKDVTISHDSVSWLDVRTEGKAEANIRQIGRLIIKNHFIGGLKGMGFGLFVGGGLGALVGSALNIRSTAESGSQTSGFGALVGLVLGGGTGAVIGLATGLINGQSYNYELPIEERSDSLQNGK